MSKSKQEKELIRRLKKMEKHVDALRPLVGSERQQNVLDEIQGGLTFLRDAQKPTELPHTPGLG